MERSEQELVRRSNLEKIRALGIEPFPAALYPVDTLAATIRKGLTTDAEGQVTNFQDVCLAGRLMGVRVMGKAAFAELQDS
ncbi:MAG: lysine--tRNA ligase, partial [Lewinella sp.]|nr:lysine--tRNA ligase [Lewinella sp.]